MFDTDGKNQQFCMFLNKDTLVTVHSNCSSINKNNDTHKGEEAGRMPENFRLNKNFIIFWNKNHIWTYELGQHFREQQQAFEVGHTDGNRYIKEIRVGSNDKDIAIIVNNSANNDTVINWNLKKNKEKQSMDVGKVYEIVWDKEGKLFIA